MPESLQSKLARWGFNVFPHTGARALVRQVNAGW